MRIGILDADLLDGGTRHPNLALLKISGYYKDRGVDVNLITDYADLDYDKVFLSQVFKFTSLPNGIFGAPNVIYGGTGIFPNGGTNLPDFIEHHEPDYDLYNSYIDDMVANGSPIARFNDYLNYSIGFATRGCFRKCDFCVNKKYDRTVKHSPISEFYDPSRKGIYLWDDNFFAYAGWEAILDEIEETGKPFQFRQGLDIRLMTKRKAERFAKAKYKGDFIFAFDNLADREIIEKKLTLWREHSERSTKLYVFCGFLTQDARDISSVFERIKIIMSYGCLPYVMRHENYKGSQWETMYTTLARWCNQPSFFKKMSFRQFVEANQALSKTGNEVKCLRVMREFEKTYPEIAKKYFDMRFDTERR